MYSSLKSPCVQSSRLVTLRISRLPLDSVVSDDTEYQNYHSQTPVYVFNADGKFTTLSFYTAYSCAGFKYGWKAQDFILLYSILTCWSFVQLKAGGTLHRSRCNLVQLTAFCACYIVTMLLTYISTIRLTMFITRLSHAQSRQRTHYIILLSQSSTPLIKTITVQLHHTIIA